MLHTRTAIEYRDGAAAVVPAIVGVDTVVDEVDHRQARLAAERALDQVLADSFPASDPPSWNPGIIRPHPTDGFATNAVPAQNGDKRLRMADVMDVSRPPPVGRTFLQVLGSLFGAAGITLLLGVAILLVGLPIALVVRGLLEVTGWLFDVALH